MFLRGMRNVVERLESTFESIRLHFGPYILGFMSQYAGTDSYICYSQAVPWAGAHGNEIPGKGKTIAKIPHIFGILIEDAVISWWSLFLDNVNMSLMTLWAPSRGCFWPRHEVKRIKNTGNLPRSRGLTFHQLSAADTNAEKTIHTLRSSNLPFYSAIWEAAKASKALVTFHKRFYWDQRPTRDSKRTEQKRCALVDVVADDGEEWIKVSSKHYSELLDIPSGLFCIRNIYQKLGKLP